jgi:hypothetical protein
MYPSCRPVWAIQSGSILFGIDFVQDDAGKLPGGLFLRQERELGPEMRLFHKVSELFERESRRSPVIPESLHIHTPGILDIPRWVKGSQPEARRYLHRRQTVVDGAGHVHKVPYPFHAKPLEKSLATRLSVAAGALEVDRAMLNLAEALGGALVECREQAAAQTLPAPFRMDNAPGIEDAVSVAIGNPQVEVGVPQQLAVAPG